MKLVSIATHAFASKALATWWLRRNLRACGEWSRRASPSFTHRVTERASRATLSTLAPMVLLAVRLPPFPRSNSLYCLYPTELFCGTAFFTVQEHGLATSQRASPPCMLTPQRRRRYSHSAKAIRVYTMLRRTILHCRARRQKLN